MENGLMRMFQRKVLISIVASFACAVIDPVIADTVSTPVSWTNTQTTRFPLPFPSGSVATTFTSYTGTAFPYHLNSFHVGAPGPFNFALSGLNPSVGAGIYIVRGPFSPNAAADPSTALSNILAGTQAPPSISNLSLTSGQEYSYLLVFSSGSGTGTLTLDGPGCISLGAVDLCAVPPAPTANFVLVSNTITFGVARVLDDLTNGTPEMRTAVAALAALDGNQQSSALQKLVPIPSRGLQVTSLTGLTAAFDRVGARLDGIRLSGYSIDGGALAYSGTAARGLASGDAPTKYGTWIKTFGVKSRQGTKDGYAGYDSDGWGIIAGADREFSPGLVGGVALSYADISVNYNDQLDGNRNGVESIQLTAYGFKDFGTVYLDGMLAYARHRYDSLRDTVINGFADGKFDGDHWGFRLGGGLPIALSRNTSLTPQLHLEWNKLDQESYTESGGGALALNVASNTAERIRSSLGAQLSHDMVLAGVNSRPYAELFWHHDFKNDGIDSTANFVGGGAAFVTPGQKLDDDTYSLGLGINFFAKENFTANVAYSLTKGSSYTSQTAQASLRWEF